MPTRNPFLSRSTLSAVAIALATAIIPQPASAVDVYTDPVGFISHVIVGTNSVPAPTYSFLGLGMTQLVTNRGVISAVAGTKITVNNTLPNAGFNAVANGPQYFIEVTSGSNAGLTEDIVSNDTAAVFTATDISSLIAATQTYKIYPHWTLAKVFGPANEAGLDTTDRILVQNPLTQQFSAYFYSTGGKAGVGWRQTGGGATDRATVPLYIDQAVLLNRAAGATITNKLVGAVKLGGGALSNGYTIIPIGPTNNFVGNVYATSSMTLSNSNLYTGNPATGLTTTDKVLIHNDNTGVFNGYFWSTGGKAGVGWRQTGGGATEQGNTPIPIGASVIIQLAPGNSGFNWKAQAQY